MRGDKLSEELTRGVAVGPENAGTAMYQVNLSRCGLVWLLFRSLSVWAASRGVAIRSTSTPSPFRQSVDGSPQAADAQLGALNTVVANHGR